ncbi:MAG TPA: hypothetical protein VJL33_05030 [Candidatus Bathyarchaeia archaeon]|nr:hypothetical protein [Candidatus Bathyarchaeia archaeon]
MNARTVLGIVVVMIVAMLSVTWVAYSQISQLQTRNRDMQDQFSETQKQLDLLRNIKIYEFSSPGWWNPGGVGTIADMYVMIVNNGTTDVEGATLEIRRLDVDEGTNITRTLDILHPGETTIQERNVPVYGIFNYPIYETTPTFVATLKLSNEVVDVQILSLR